MCYSRLKCFLSFRQISHNSGTGCRMDMILGLLIMVESSFQTIWTPLSSFVCFTKYLKCQDATLVVGTSRGQLSSNFGITERLLFLSVSVSQWKAESHYRPPDKRAKEGEAQIVLLPFPYSYQQTSIRFGDINKKQEKNKRQRIASE